MNQNVVDVKNNILPPYNGNEQYIFISYALEDKFAVFPDIKRFQDMGYNVWYNDQDEFDSNAKYLNALKNCFVFVVFITPNSANSSKINDDIHFALDNEKNIIPIYLVETEIDIMLEFALMNSNAISKYKMDMTKYYSKCKESFTSFGLKQNTESLNSKLIPGIGREPLPAFRGEGEYMFISYAHKDSNIVFPEIKRFQDMGYNVWYDEGIGAGNEWLKDVLEHLVNADLFVVFVTNNSVASENVQKEIKFAIRKKINMVPIYLEDFDEIDMDIQLDYELSNIQGILKTTLDEEEYVFKFTEAFQHFGFEPTEDYGDIFERIELKNPEDILLDDSLKYDVLYSDIDSESISKYLDDFFYNLVLYDDYHNKHYYKILLKSAIDIFLENKSFYNAFYIYELFFSIYQIDYLDKSAIQYYEHDAVSSKNTILELLYLLKEHKYKNDVKQKELFTHSVNVFILGLAIYSKNKNYSHAFKSYVFESGYEKYYKIEGEFSHEEFLYRWGITSLLHDIYYPFEKKGKKVNQSIYKGFDLIIGKDRSIKDVNDLNDIARLPPYDFTDEYAHRYPETKFLDLYKPIDIIAHRISTNFKFSKEKFNLLRENLIQFIDSMNNNEFEEHGFLAALLVLNSYGYQIQECLKNPQFFFYPIVDSATAIFLHNYYKYFLQKEPFNLKKIDPYQSPLTYLLILCDDILEFNKKSETVIDNNVNMIFDLVITDNEINAKYVASSASYGFGFSNELFLDNILDIKTIFNKGLSISTDLSAINTNYDTFISNTNFSNNIMNNIEKLAKEIHNTYVRNVMDQYNELLERGETDLDLKNIYDNLCSFDELNPKLKLLNVKNAISIFNKLNTIGYEIALLDDERSEIVEFSEEDMINLAIYDHEEWCREKIDKGWIYGEIRDYDNLIHDCLVPWDELSLEVQQWDIESVKIIPSLIDSSGFKIVESKVRMLTFGMHKFYHSKDEGTEEFEDLPDYIIKLNYKKTELILETLSKLDYYVVDEYHPSEKIETLEKNELIYLAQKFYDEWYELNKSLGWRYGESYDLNLKTNPNLVIWEKLSYDYAKMQINIFKKLPELCSQLGFKIVKNIYII